MNFVNPQILYLIPAVIIFVPLAYLHAARKRKKVLRSLLGSRSDEPGAVTVSYPLRRLRAFLLLAVMILLIIACARPYWTKSLAPEMPKGRDIILLFDVSKSMLSDDVAPSRLEHGKFLLRQLISPVNEDRFGIAAFAGTSYLACPLTSNRTALNEYIDELNCELVPVGGTNLAHALKRSFEAFKAAEGNHRAIVLITDGEELSGSAQKEIDRLKKMKIPVFIAGIGDPAGVPVRDTQGNIVRTRDGKIAMTKLNETLLKAIARETGGSYIRSTATNPGIEELLGKINQLDKADREGVTRRIPIDKFPLFLIASFILFLIYMLIPERIINAGKMTKKIVIFLVLTAIPSLDAAEITPKETKSDGNAPAAVLYNNALEQQLKGSDATEMYAETLHKAQGNETIQSKCYYNLASQSHNAARKSISTAENAISSQQLDNAAKELEQAEKLLNSATPNYKTAFAFGNDRANLDTANLTAHHLDLKKVKELKKKVEELKKQQQKAQQDARNAQQQNKDKNKSQQQKQNAINQAKQSAQKMQQQAKDMKQQNMSQQAEKAAKSLEKAEQASRENKEKEAQKHLDDAVKALGADEKEGKQQKQEQGKNQDKKESEPQGDKPLEQQPQGAKSGTPKEDKIDQRNAEQLLDMLKKDEQQRRNELKMRSRQRRTNVEKDW